MCKLLDRFRKVIYPDLDNVGLDIIRRPISHSEDTHEEEFERVDQMLGLKPRSPLDVLADMLGLR
jgi:hypothetical protein